MRKKCLAIVLAVVMAAGLLPGAAFAADDAVTPITLSTEYNYAGALYSSWTLGAAGAAPVVVDLDGDGALEVLNAAHALYVMDAATGALKWRVNSGKDRSSAFSTSIDSTEQVYCDVKVADIDGDSRNEIIIANGAGTVSVLDDQGYFKPGWPQTPTTVQLRSLVVEDLDLDGKKEIIVGAATKGETVNGEDVSDPVSVWVYHCDGTLADGWPQLKNSQNGAYTTKEDIPNTAWGAAVFSNGITTGDLDNDGYPEILVPIDMPVIVAYNYDGTLVKASDVYTDEDGSRTWGKIGFFEDNDTELAHPNEGLGFGTEWGGLQSRKDKNQGQMANASIVYTDVDGDGISEVVVATMMWDRTTYATKGNNVATLADSQYMTVFVLNQDRTRFKNGEYDWTTVPNEINSEVGLHIKPDDKTSGSGNVFPVATVEDLDGDGKKEILFNSFDGKVHCFSLDWKPNADYKTLSNTWSFTLPKSVPNTIYEYATPVVCKDVNNDGKLEVVFASWTDNNAGGKTGANGALYVLDYKGNLLASVDLHDPYNADMDTIVRAAPYVGDVDGDGKCEILLNTTGYALCAYQVNKSSGSGGTAATRFTDLESNQVWYHEAVYWAVENGIATGTGNSQFSPTKLCTHGEIITFLWRASGFPASADYSKGAALPIAKGQYYTAAAYWAASLDMIDETFTPTDYCTRGEVAAYFWLAKGKPGGPDYIPRFNDGNPEQFEGYYANPQWQGINWFKREGISNGDGKNNYNPDKTIDRREIATLLYRTYVPEKRLTVK